MRLSTLAIALVLWSACAAAAQAAPQLNACVLAKSGGQWDGDCGDLDGHTPRFSIALEPEVATGQWRADRAPDGAYSGVMGEAGYRPTRIELEVYPDRTGVLRTMQGWFPVSNVSATAATVRFDLDPSHEVAPGPLDRKIIQRAGEILSSEAVWNRADNRLCRDGATNWSVYCALRQATVEVTGAFHHRRPALELVRQIVRERVGEREYDHGLMDYNNDRSTTLADVRSLFAEAERRIPAEAR
jgi:hypothetical protein